MIEAYFWTPEWQAAEHDASADIAEGRTHEADNIDELIAGLKAAREPRG